MTSKSQILEREKRWTLVAGIASVMGVAIILATYGNSSAAVRATDGLADRLTEIAGNHPSLIVASIGQFVGWALLAVPLVFLFKAAAARAPQVRTALLVAMIVAPFLIGLGSLVSAGSIIQAADDFKVDQAELTQCVSDKVADEDSDVTDQQKSDFQTVCEDEQAKDFRSHTSLAPVETGFGLAGLLGFTVSVIYVSLWAMRTGLLSRFWGSLGIALGAVFAFFTLFTLIWFIYVGLLLAGWVPGGRPPAWASGEAKPWPKPGNPGNRGDENVIEGTAEEVDAADLESGFADSDDPDGTGGGSQAERRKRKKRN
jgi:hypothetical protein